MSKSRVLDNRVSAAWLEAAADLGISVIAPFSLKNATGEVIAYEAHILDFGGPMGTVVGGLEDDVGDARRQSGFFLSNLANSYQKYDPQLFIDTLNDWQWFGEKGKEPCWYTGKPWT
jgi:hypothetical protein